MTRPKSKTEIIHCILNKPMLIFDTYFEKGTMLIERKLGTQRCYYLEITDNQGNRKQTPVVSAYKKEYYYDSKNRKITIGYLKKEITKINNGTKAFNDVVCFAKPFYKNSIAVLGFLEKKYPYLPLCIDMAKNYDKFSEGVYTDDKHDFIIEKRSRKWMQKKQSTLSDSTPVSVSRQTGNVVIFNDLEKMSYSAKLFSLVWGFNKLSLNKLYTYPNIIVDAEVINVCKQVDDFKLKEALTEIIQLLPPNIDKRRVELLIKILKEVKSK